ncbi:hypothetical protein [Planococcus maritimus]|nr:hypothetical protein [Planococcus maritimus]
MHEAAKLSIRMVAEEIGVGRSTAESYIDRAKKKVRERFQLSV